MKWEIMRYGYRAELNGMVFFIEKSTNVFRNNKEVWNLSVKETDSSSQNHITGGLPIPKLKKLAEKFAMAKTAS